LAPPPLEGRKALWEKDREEPKKRSKDNISGEAENSSIELKGTHVGHVSLGKLQQHGRMKRWARRSSEERGGYLLHASM